MFSTTGCGSLAPSLSTTEPPVTVTRQGSPGVGGASKRLNSVIRFAPDWIWNGIVEVAPIAIPVERQFGAIDRRVTARIVRVADQAGIGIELAFDDTRQRVRSDFGADRSGERNIGLELSVADPGRQKQILGIDALEIDAHQLALEAALPDRGAELPRPLRHPRN